MATQEQIKADIDFTFNQLRQPTGDNTDATRFANTLTNVIVLARAGKLSKGGLGLTAEEVDISDINNPRNLMAVLAMTYAAGKDAGKGAIVPRHESEIRDSQVYMGMYDALKGIFEHCVMTHKHWGEGCNRKEADAAIAAGREAIANAERIKPPLPPFVATDESIGDLADEALNAACLLIQRRLGVTTGDLAGMHFSDGEARMLLVDYIGAELGARPTELPL